ncbi:ATP adenylyltransferase-domain-containing protein [Irpex rosettiformis]|uniref:ATP adenylyltransferase-domain-containing protein n=1 Tax=Irpex rosettiformis TaxID=378272 RepID=A0ACB8UFH1_9APHY|nr:ATP adenylyltransferase-domain-containing protein [Irpex rosettiformis]
MPTVPSTPAEIIAQLPSSFAKAKDSGDVLFFPSTVHKHSEFGVEWEITLCPALQNKPPLPIPHFDAAADAKLANGGKKFDPFAPPYVPNLHIGELKDEQEGDEYVILFNKFSVVPQHILLVTKEFHSQTSPLLPPDLVQTYRLIAAAREAGKKFFAFYNCGDNSGASQPHKHLQLIPTIEDGPPIEKLARKTPIETLDRPFSLQSLPYANHVRRLPTHLPTVSLEEQEPILSRAFLSLLDLALSTYRRDPASDDQKHNITLSYNVILTLEHMHIIPRKAETHTLAETGENLSINAMGFAGCLLVKSEREFEAVVKESVGTILENVGCKSIHEQQCEGACSM